MAGLGRRAALLIVALAGCTNDVADRAFTDFVVAVEDETFVIRAEDPETIRLGLDVLNGRVQRFRIGPLVIGVRP
jgi:hypothetical protein